MGPRSDYSVLFDQSRLTNRYSVIWGGGGQVTTTFGPFNLAWCHGQIF